MIGTYLKFYVHENRKHGGVLIYEWILEAAKNMGIDGGSAFRSIAGYGRHGVLHEDHFFELAGDLPVEVVFAVESQKATQLLNYVNDAGLNVFYITMPIEYGITAMPKA
ncbi:MAG TPA: DUF190 domain-containing protein [Opitutales bacterium]|nr:DUF190 domain-containing protein [Opitutales bacterium]